MISPNLKQRIVTAAVLVPLLFGALFWLPANGIALMFAVIIGIGAWEWARLAALEGGSRYGYVAAIVLVGGISVANLLTQADHSWLPWLMGSAVLFWLAALVEMVRGVQSANAIGLYTRPFGKRVCGFLVLVPTWVAGVYLVVVDGQRPWLLLYAMALVWVADTFAYMAGHKWGSHKLAPSVSPGKTIEGVAGGFGGAMLLAVVVGIFFFSKSGANLVWWALLSAVAALISVLGDLVESQFKRLAGVKDSGAILPGHGGVLDRIDAQTAALPVFALGWYVMSRGGM